MGGGTERLRSGVGRRPALNVGLTRYELSGKTGWAGTTGRRWYAGSCGRHSAGTPRASIGNLLAWAKIAPTMRTVAEKPVGWLMADDQDPLQTAAAQPAGVPPRL